MACVKEPVERNRLQDKYEQKLLIHLNNFFFPTLTRISSITYLVWASEHQESKPRPGLGKMHSLTDVRISEHIPFCTSRKRSPSATFAHVHS